MLWKKKVHLGLDIGGFALKLCALEGSQATCHVACKELQPERQTREETLDSEGLLKRLKELLAEAERHSPYWSKRVILATADQGLTAAYLELPKLASSQLKTAIPSAVAREIPQSLKEVEISHLLVPALSDPATRSGVFFLAMPRSAANSKTAMLTQLGYEVVHHEPGLLALIRGLARNGGIAADESVVVVDCGFRQTTVLWMHGGHPYFAREFRLAGADFTYAIQMSEQCDWERAEQIKLARDLHYEHYELEPFVMRWLDELKRSIAFAGRKLGGRTPARVLLTGGTSQWPGLAQRAQGALQLPVSRNVWQQMKAETKADPHSIAPFDTAIGLVSGR